MATWKKPVEDFCCLKCRNKTAITKEITLPKSSLPDFFQLKSGRYLFLTCSLCGYTEIYDQAVYAKKTEKAQDESHLRQEA